ncbi:hypothetical protein FGIG_01325 [Fasciola gigantica]|uniref:Uncharacterized protein n=1 Tax=Fasciola gigantica TaxID=46835 RepID=A0A504Z676_FASGI|nr:hypothetical protein FGIG_01325 [Fasciola gigantica]
MKMQYVNVTFATFNPKHGLAHIVLDCCASRINYYLYSDWKYVCGSCNYTGPKSPASFQLSHTQSGHRRLDGGDIGHANECTE